MFTGIIQALGQIASVEDRGDRLLTIKTILPLDDVALGASIACSGVCLTVVAKEAESFSVQMSHETMDVTTAGLWSVGRKINLERALRMGDELGGHMVLGHVDGVARVVSKREEGESLRFRFAVPEALAPFIASKGSVAIDGVSLTVNEVEGSVFGVNIIPHTQKNTCFGFYDVGASVNIEIDVMARYIARMNSFR